MSCLLREQLEENSAILQRLACEVQRLNPSYGYSFAVFFIDQHVSKFFFYFKNPGCQEIQMIA
ncbi:hypothetical protein CEP88_05030 [Roseobacter denitrificans]|nr:hypothetical protein CEP88_05030 [Roseobacter denitrificans]